nr:uncharacterized protein LOC111420148 isoform X2 [Onthophagus taurus]
MTNSNCLICLLRPIFTYSSIITTQIVLSCPHRDEKFKIEYSKLFGAISTVIFLISLTLLIIFYQIFLKSTESIIEVVFIIHGMFSYTRMANLTFFGHLRVKEKIMELKQLVKVLNEASYYGIEVFLTETTIQRYKTWSVVAITGAALLEGVFLLSCSFYFDTTLWTLMEQTTNVFCSFLHVIAVGNYILFGFLYKKLFSVCLNEMKRDLGEKNCFMVINNKKKFNKLIRLYLKLMKCYEIYGKSAEEIDTISLIMYIAMFINTAFLIYIGCYYETINYRFVFNSMQSLSGFIIISFYLFQIEGLKHIGNDLKSFIFKFPINSLDSFTSNQVELALILLEIKTPLIRPLQMFTVGSSLIMFASTITYVLVALQFHVMFSD